MAIEKLWLEYLELINDMTKTPGAAYLDKIRAEVHKDMTDYYMRIYPDNFNQARFNFICHNLDKIIGFKPPLEAFDHIKPYAQELSRRFADQDLKNYVTEVISQIKDL